MTAVSYLIMATSSSASLLFLAACLQLNSVTTVGCPDTHIIYTGYLDISTISTQVSIRSQLSKLVGAGHSGKVTNERPSSGHVTTLLTCDWLQVFSVVGVGQSVVSLLSHSVFGLVYSLTLATQVPSIYTIYSIYNIYSTVSTTSTISTIYNIYLIYQPTAYLAIVIGSLVAAVVSVVVVQLTVWRTHGDTAPTPG